LLKDYAWAVTASLKKEDSLLFLVGERRFELGGSAYWRHLGREGGTPPEVRFPEVRSQLKTVLEAIERGMVLACHDIGEGGLAVAAAEMALPSRLGLRLEVDALPSGLRRDAFVFSETGGFLVEADAAHGDALVALGRSHGVPVSRLGVVRDDRKLEFVIEGTDCLSLDLDRLEPMWRGGFREAWR
jgi:phosphoribosylformylglycinamidine synthase